LDLPHSYMEALRLLMAIRGTDLDGAVRVLVDDYVRNNGSSFVAKRVNEIIAEQAGFVPAGKMEKFQKIVERLGIPHLAMAWDAVLLGNNHKYIKILMDLVTDCLLKNEPIVDALSGWKKGVDLFELLDNYDSPGEE